MAYRTEIVVARYNENINWLLPFKHIVRIQNKGDRNTIHSDLQEKVVDIDNIGLDQYCHLMYILQNYENLPDVIIFIQADMEKHTDAFDTTDVLKILQNLDIEGSTLGKSTNAKLYRMDGAMDTNANMKVTKEYPQEDDSGYTYGEWFEKFVRPNHTFEKHYWFKNAIFSVRKCYILSRPKVFYERILNEIKNIRGEVLHYIERSWYYMLNMDYDLIPCLYTHTLHVYKGIFNALDDIVRASGQETVEGSIFFYGNKDMTYNSVFLHKQMNLFEIAKNASMILEIGFNAGHSAALMLLANPLSKLVIVDIAEHAYAKQCFRFLQSVFGDERLMFIEGDSREKLIELPINDIYDVIHIDGGHTEDILKSDIDNCRRYSDKKTKLIIDDINIPSIKQVIDKYINEERIHPLPGNFYSYMGTMLHFIGTYTF